MLTAAQQQEKITGARVEHVLFGSMVDKMGEITIRTIGCASAKI
ncbi:hypothetical protein [Nitrosomonas mobilis]|nr:hypothetical protein [Nitrosomonas mobilis]HNO76379.1 hypothetical protein [Nitrosomonas mobilis]